MYSWNVPPQSPFQIYKYATGHCFIRLYFLNRIRQQYKIVSRLISLTISLAADPNIMDLLRREHPKF